MAIFAARLVASDLDGGLDAQVRDHPLPFFDEPTGSSS